MIEMTSTRTIAELEDAHTSGAYPKRPLTLVRGEGCTVWDEAGNSYLDMTSGQGVTMLGHCHPAVVAAVAEQSRTLISCPEIFYNDRRAQALQLLAGVMPGDLNRFFLCNSGAEAVETALKVARLLTGREGVVAAMRSFHGRTLGALSLTWNKKYREPFEGWGVDVQHMPYNDIESARTFISSSTAAVVVEAVQGEGGVYPADPGYLQALRAICDEQGALLIVDEIQTGFGRTGRWFGFEHEDILPDIVTLGKGIAGGLAMAAVAWRESLGTIPRGSHGSTFGGNPLAAAAAVATISAIRDEGLPQCAAELGRWLLDELHQLELPQVREIRGQGLMIGLELRGRVTPALQALQEQGILALPAGLNVLRLLPPLVVTRDELQQLIDALRVVLA